VDTLVPAPTIHATGFFEIRNNVGVKGDNFLFFIRLLQDPSAGSPALAKTNLQRANILSCAFATVP
jgi:hypothetical protein